MRQTKFKVVPGNVHLIGHSMGAQISGNNKFLA